MFKSFALIPIITSVALAQGPSSLIPQDISPKCSSFLENLNTDTTITGCTSAIIRATSAFAPGSRSAQNATMSDLTTALGSLCSSTIDNTCTIELVGPKVAAFYSACSAELTSNLNNNVLGLYDAIFTLLPLKTAICSLDDGGNFCSIQARLPPSTTANGLQEILASPSSNNPQVSLPNYQTLRTTNLPFLFLQPSLPASDICNVCTRKIMNAYLAHLSKVPYGPGLDRSLILKDQPTLYKGIQEKCGNNFLSDAGVVKAAGGLAGGTLTGGALQLDAVTQSLVATGMGLLAFVASSAL